MISVVIPVVIPGEFPAKHPPRGHLLLPCGRQGSGASVPKLVIPANLTCPATLCKVVGDGRCFAGNGLPAYPPHSPVLHAIGSRVGVAGVLLETACRHTRLTHPVLQAIGNSAGVAGVLLEALRAKDTAGDRGR